jgi:hypothetical protein
MAEVSLIVVTPIAHCKLNATLCLSFVKTVEKEGLLLITINTVIFLLQQGLQRGKKNLSTPIMPQHSQSYPGVIKKYSWCLFSRLFLNE